MADQPEHRAVKTWAGLVVGLYGLTLAVLALPLTMVLFQDDLPKAAGIYHEWPFWIWCALMVLDQAALLALPVGATPGRPVRRRQLVSAVLGIGFAIAALCGTGVASVLAVVFGDKSPSLGPIDVTLGAGTLVIAVSWATWGFVFWKYAAQRDPNSAVSGAMRWLLRGSVLELLVAVPAHVLVRRRDDCCAPLATSAGIATGLSVMLMSFGPGVLFLYRRRAKALQPASRR
jgi:hypothetical protein